MELIAVAPEGVPKHPALAFWILLGIFWFAGLLSSEPLLDAGSLTTVGLARL